MKQYLAYFDYLGYKAFILNNDSDYLKRRANHMLRDFETALGQGKFVDQQSGVVVADLSNSRINCFNFSDTVIFTTIDDSASSLEELTQVAKRFNWQQILYNMPVRGVLYYDEIAMMGGRQRNANGAWYSSNLIYGRSLVNAHLKCENLSWAGCVIDQTVIDRISEMGIDPAEFLAPHAKLYNVPYKLKPPELANEYALNINEGGLNEIAFKHFSDRIRERFAADHKPVDSPRVQEIMNNTIDFLATYRLQ